MWKRSISVTQLMRASLSTGVRIMFSAEDESQSSSFFFFFFSLQQHRLRWRGCCQISCWNDAHFQTASWILWLLTCNSLLTTTSIIVTPITAFKPGTTVRRHGDNPREKEEHALHFHSALICKTNAQFQQRSLKVRTAERRVSESSSQSPSQSESALWCVQESGNDKLMMTKRFHATECYAEKYQILQIQQTVTKAFVENLTAVMTGCEIRTLKPVNASSESFSYYVDVFSGTFIRDVWRDNRGSNITLGDAFHRPVTSPQSYAQWNWKKRDDHLTPLPFFGRFLSPSAYFSSPASVKYLPT